jgi:hypothetical protein
MANVPDIQQGPHKWPSAAGVARRLSLVSVVRSRVFALGLGLLVIGALAWPLIFSSSVFNGDWEEQLWFMSQQALAMRFGHLPSLFLDYPRGVLYPHYAFYGGPLYTLSGALTLALGDAPVTAYVLTYLLGFAAAYGGWYWIGRMAGLGRFWAHVPGLVFITSAYYLTLIYTRGDWPEFIGVSVIPLLIAAGVSVLRADRLRLWPGLALAGASIVFFGSHTLTLVWGGTLMIAVGLAIVMAVPRARSGLTWSGAIRVAGLVGPALLIDAWFLVPAAAYEATTNIASEYQSWRAVLHRSMPLVSARHLFALSRKSANGPGSSANFALTLPVLVIGWVLASTAIFLRRGPRATWVRMLLIFLATASSMLVLMTNAGLILALPRAFSTLQFSYRLESYILLALSGAVLSALVLGERAGPGMRRWSWTILPVLALSFISAVGQVDGYPHSGERRIATEGFYPKGRPDSGPILTDYLDVHQPILENFYGPAPSVDFTPASVQDDRVTARVRLPAGQLLDTNLQAPPALVHMTGARIAGIDGAGYDVIEIGSAGVADWRASGPVWTRTITVSPGSSFPVLLGRGLALVGVIALLAELLLVCIRRRRPASQVVEPHV